MEQRAYYSVENLSLFTQMVAVTEQVYRLCQPEKTTVITTVTFMDVVEYLDLLDDLSKLLYNINQFFKKQLGRPFFYRIPDYKQWRQDNDCCHAVSGGVCTVKPDSDNAAKSSVIETLRYCLFIDSIFSFSYGFLRRHCLSSASRNKKVISSRIRSHSPCQVSLTRNPSSFW